MILLDTNIVSEAMRPRPDARVITWLNDEESVRLHLSAITVGEIEYGLRSMPQGEKQAGLRRRFLRFVNSAFSGRIIEFGHSAAMIYGEVMADRRAAGRPMSTEDGQIASIALEHQFKLATRNTKDFEGCGLDLINPFA